MTHNEITVPVRLDAKTLKRFSVFDTLRLRRRWVRPVGFALILAAFAVVALLTGKAQAGMIAAVLLVVGLGLPLVYFGTFFSQVNVLVLVWDIQHRVAGNDLELAHVLPPCKRAPKDARARMSRGGVPANDSHVEVRWQPSARHTALAYTRRATPRH